mmetsp:Transcript_13800/g.37041  ORF Transcript_13800/g.37041 Transcript_13800/m.37041 type:complete len:249 (-) Transcript_13800:1418-2164(-)
MANQTTGETSTPPCGGTTFRVATSSGSVATTIARHGSFASVAGNHDSGIRTSMSSSNSPSTGPATNIASGSHAGTDDADSLAAASADASGTVKSTPAARTVPATLAARISLFLASSTHDPLPSTADFAPPRAEALHLAPARRRRAVCTNAAQLPRTARVARTSSARPARSPPHQPTNAHLAAIRAHCITSLLHPLSLSLSLSSSLSPHLLPHSATFAQAPPSSSRFPQSPARKREEKCRSRRLRKTCG